MKHIHFGRYALSVSVAALLVGCGGSAPPLTPSSTSAIAPSKKSDKDPWLYVSGNLSNNVVIYDLGQKSYPKVGEIDTGISSPGGIALDKKGNLYVANLSGSVTIYPPGGTSPNATLTDQLSTPESVALDPSGDLYVCNRGSSPSIVVFHSGKMKAAKVITNQLIQSPTQIQFDSQGNLFYADAATGVSELPAGSGSQDMVSLHLQDLQRVDGIALDPTDGNFFVSTYGNQLDGVLVFAPHFRKPLRQLEDSAGADFSNAGSPNRQYIYVPNHYTNTVKAFRSNSRVPAYVVSTGGAGHSVGVAVKPAGVP